MVRRLAVTSSPSVPSPRVAPRTKLAMFVGQVDRQARRSSARRRTQAARPRQGPGTAARGRRTRRNPRRRTRCPATASARGAELGKPALRRAADAVGRRIGGSGRETRLDRGVAPAQRVVVGVGDLRRVVLVVGAIVVRDLAARPQFAAASGSVRSSDEAVTSSDLRGARLMPSSRTLSPRTRQSGPTLGDGGWCPNLKFSVARLQLRDASSLLQWPLSPSSAGRTATSGRTLPGSPPTRR